MQSITKHSADHFTIFNLDVEKSAVILFNLVDTSCMMIQIVPLNIVKNGGMFCGGLWKKSVCYNTYSSHGSSWISNGFGTTHGPLNLDPLLDPIWTPSGPLLNPHLDPFHSLPKLLKKGSGRVRLLTRKCANANLKPRSVSNANCITFVASSMSSLPRNIWKRVISLLLISEH